MSEAAWLGAVALVAVASLVAWRWWLSQRRWELTHKAVERDAALAELTPRMKALETKINDVEWSRALKR